MARPMYQFGQAAHNQQQPRPANNFTFRMQRDHAPSPSPHFERSNNVFSQSENSRRSNNAGHHNNSAPHQGGSRQQPQNQQQHRDVKRSRVEPPRGRNQGRRGNDQRRGYGQARGYEHRRGGWRGKEAPSQRDLLMTQREPTPEQMEGMNGGPSRFKDLNDISESEDEPDMSPENENCQEDNSEDGEPSRKKARVSATKERPKWSNPDPYTVLPPVDESIGKRKDVVQLIRKAKAATSASKNSITDGDDFISFDFDSLDASLPQPPKSIVGIAKRDPIEYVIVSDNTDEDDRGASGPTTRTKPSNTMLQNGHVGTQLAPKPLSIPLPAKPTAPYPSAPGTAASTISQWPPPPPPPPSFQNNSSTEQAHGRKRGHDEYEADSSNLLENAKPLKKGKSSQRLGRNIVPAWRPKPNTSCHPWLRGMYTGSELAMDRLHREICDFYDYLKPRQYENDLRQDLVTSLQGYIDKAFPGSRLRYFGSFAAGLYLPEGDMDLVVFTARFLKSGSPTPGKNHLFAFRTMLEKNRIARPGSIVVISKAKVPIVKYVDHKTGLKVDISFDNNTGVTANETYRLWKDQFTAMPILVTLVKQFLLMRNLNEVHTGGLGGFSVTCIVVSMLQMTQPRDPAPRFSELFLDFLDLYGNKFNMATTGLELNPPRHFDKAKENRFATKQKAHKGHNQVKLSIVDPNRPNNDISGGSTLASRIFQEFSVALAALNERVQAVDKGGKSDVDDDGSILGVIFAGDYTTFDRQRERMWALSHPSR